MKTLLLAITIAVAVPGISSAKDLKLEPQPSADQTINYSKGYARLFSRAKESAVVTSYLNEAIFGRPTFYIGGQNTMASKGELNFGPQNIKVTFNGQPVQILTNEELARNMSNRAATANALSGLGDMTRRMNGDTLGRVNNELKRRDTQNQFAQAAQSLDRSSLKMETLSFGRSNEGVIVLEKLHDAGPGKDLVFEFDIGPDHHVLRYRTM